MNFIKKKYKTHKNNRNDLIKHDLKLVDNYHIYMLVLMAFLVNNNLTRLCQFIRSNSRKMSKIIKIHTSKITRFSLLYYIQSIIPNNLATLRYLMVTTFTLITISLI